MKDNWLNVNKGTNTIGIVWLGTVSDETAVDSSLPRCKEYIVYDSARRHRNAKSNNVEIATNCKGMHELPNQHEHTINEISQSGKDSHSFVWGESANGTCHVNDSDNKQKKELHENYF